MVLAVPVYASREWAMKFREEVLNVKLAEILSKFGLRADPEIIQGSHKMPDVRILVGGLKVILEGKAEAARAKLTKQAKERLETGFADISIAILYGNRLFEADSTEKLADKLATAKYSGRVFHWGTEGVQEIPLHDMSVNELVELLNNIYTLYINNDLLSRKIGEIDEAIGRLAGEAKQTSLFFHGTAVEAKLKEALGIGETDGKEEDEDGEG